MGCASVEGKRDQHATRVLTQSKLCIGCGQCEKICPQHAITLGEDKKAHIDTAKCIGCFECITVCQPKAIAI
ncbi:MAG: 4Fe-4S binding protein, partial [Bilophila sp.]